MKSKIKFFIPAEIEKSQNAEGQEEMRFKGIASTTDEDSQEEELDPSTFELRDVLWVNWNHAGSKDPASIIGEAPTTKITKDKKLYVEGTLYPEVPMAQATWRLMKALQNSPSGNKLGISVEGKVTERDPFNSKKILKARITGMAICPVPINGNTWADVLKGEIDSDDEDEEEKYDDETKKAMSLESNPGLVKEDVEGKKNKLKPLTKSEIFVTLLSKANEDIEKTKSLYNFIKKISNMSESKTPEITQETIEKAFQILELAFNSQTISKGEVEKEKEDEEEEEDDDNEMVEKALSIMKAMDGKSKEEMFKSMDKKGYSPKVIEKAYSCIDDANQNKNGGDVTQLSKSLTEVQDLVKGIKNDFETKLVATTTILRSQTESLDSLRKSFNDVTLENNTLKSKIEGLEKAPMLRKSVTGVGYSDRFEKSEDGSKTFNVANENDRKNLMNFLEEKSGINNPSIGANYDKVLMGAAQDLEIVKSISNPQALSKLYAMGIKVVSE